MNSTLKIQKSEATLIEQIKAEIKKRSEAKAKRMLLKRPKRLAKTLRLVDQLVGVTRVFEERLQQPP